MATLNWRGQWTNSNTYASGDVVYNLSATYVALSTNTYVVPAANPSTWAVLATLGSVGATGAAGANGSNGQGFTWRNTYSSSITYNAYDCVNYSGIAYICIANGTLSQQPDISPSYWNPLLG